MCKRYMNISVLFLYVMIIMSIVLSTYKHLDNLQINLILTSKFQS